ncbi:hypothetical protein VP01_1021g3 [Puccinia sorghi]|uniref:CCHC-type domain-containing protein n=1 Tax=Puccinia sorghi TaxID=27349 RepID=A0A0L6VV53_9BASI|nr:hypothetical protein VP01_1021g3 [Puccinia sorghi]
MVVRGCGVLGCDRAVSGGSLGFSRVDRHRDSAIEVIAQATAEKEARLSASKPFADDIKRQFLKSPLKFYKEVNPRKPILSFNGSNYVKWESVINRTLQHTFVLEKSFLNNKQDKFLGLDLLKNKAVAALICSTLDEALLSIESQELSFSKELLICESWLARFCSVMSDIEHSKLTINKFSCLFLQAIVKAPPGTDAKDFEYSISQPLDNMSNPPSFGKVATIIQSALSTCSKGLATTLFLGTIPSDVEMSVNAIKGCHSNHYELPNCHTADQNNHPRSQKSSAKKATFYYDKSHTECIMEQFRFTCLYCKEIGHWYSDCENFWEDSNGRIQKIDVPEANDGIVLLDSGSIINVSGTSRFFTITAKLDSPLIIFLAILSYIAAINTRTNQ